MYCHNIKGIIIAQLALHQHGQVADNTGYQTDNNCCSRTDKSSSRGNGNKPGDRS